MGYLQDPTKIVRSMKKRTSRCKDVKSCKVLFSPVHALVVVVMNNEKKTSESIG